MQLASEIIERGCVWCGVKTEKGKELKFNPSTQYRYIGHGYALTDYKSQGQTEKHVIYHADTTKGVNFNQAYVGITRGKKSVIIYTDDKARLMEEVKHEQIKTSTLDYDLAMAKSANHERLIKRSELVPTITAQNMAKNKSSDKSLSKLDVHREMKENWKERSRGGLER